MVFATATAVDAPIRSRSTPSWWWTAIVAICWARATVVAGVWLAHGGSSALTDSAGTAWTSVGRLTGLVAADLLLVQVFLMARVPPVERTFGQDGLARRHRTVGTWSSVLMLTHIVTTMAGYALAEQRDVLAETWAVTTTYPGMLLATAGTLALVVVATSSARAARRRLRYESWHLLHLYAYLGVGFAVPHELWTGTDLENSAVRAYWWVSYVLAAGAVSVWRVGLPIYRSLRHRLRVDHVVPEGPGVVSVYLTGRHLGSLAARSGQFLVFRFLDGRGWTRGKPYSLSAAPDGRVLRVTVKAAGENSSRLALLRPGTRALVEGPYGTLTAERRTRDTLVLAASGIGISPIRALLEDLPISPGRAVLIYRARDAADLVLRREIEVLCAQRGVALYLLLGHRADGENAWLPRRDDGWPADPLLRFAPWLHGADVFVCGPPAWTDSLRAAAVRAGLPADRFHEERFAW